MSLVVIWFREKGERKKRITCDDGREQLVNREEIDIASANYAKIIVITEYW